MSPTTVSAMFSPCISVDIFSADGIATVSLKNVLLPTKIFCDTTRAQIIPSTSVDGRGTREKQLCRDVQFFSHTGYLNDFAIPSAPPTPSAPFESTCSLPYANVTDHVTDHVTHNDALLNMEIVLETKLRPVHAPIAPSCNPSNDAYSPSCVVNTVTHCTSSPSLFRIPETPIRKTKQHRISYLMVVPETPLMTTYTRPSILPVSPLFILNTPTHKISTKFGEGRRESIESSGRGESIESNGRGESIESSGRGESIE